MMKGRIWWGEVPGAGLCQICVSAPPVERKHRRNIIAPNGPRHIYFQIFHSLGIYAARLTESKWSSPHFHPLFHWNYYAPPEVMHIFCKYTIIIKIIIIITISAKMMLELQVVVYPTAAQDCMRFRV